MRDESARATQVILPGVGAAGPGMARLRELGLVEVLRALTQPVLGVCLGMQLLFEHSEEGDTTCLGVMPGHGAPLRRAIRSCACRTWAGTASMSLATIRCWPGLATTTTPISCTAMPSPAAAHTLASSDYGEPLAAVVRHRQFPRHAVPSRAFGRRRRASAEEFPRTHEPRDHSRHRPARRPRGAPAPGRLRARDRL